MDWNPKKFFTEEEVEAAKTARGGFSQASLRKLGVPWPPPKGWRRAITRRAPIERASTPLGDPIKRTPEEWGELLPKIAGWAFKKPGNRNLPPAVPNPHIQR